MKKKLFELGQVVQTRGLFAETENNKDALNELYTCFYMYCSGNWGDTCDDDKLLNDNAIKNNDKRIVAKYHLETLNKDIFIITEWDRTQTTLMFCNEY